MTEHHRDGEESGIWEAINEGRKNIAQIQATQATALANHENIKESLVRVEAAINTFTSQSREHAIEDGKHYQRIDKLEVDINNLAAKLREHMENHKFWLGLTLGIPAVLLTLWQLLGNIFKK